MTVLNAADRLKCRVDFVAELMAARETTALTKADLQAAADALDDWLDANAAAINAAIPQPARASLTAKQKARLLRYVIKRRYEVE